MTKQELIVKVIDIFKLNEPLPETELEYKNPYELLVAVILSAQCTDKRVNIITPNFFKKFPDHLSLAHADFEEVFDVIKSCSYPNNKSKNLIGMAQTLENEFKGIVPNNVEDLQRLPGVGRKTANVVASVAFDVPTMPVDTHVFRVAQRIGLVKPSKTPREVEDQLVKITPKDLLQNLHHWLILHGRYVCVARKPKCNQCQIVSICKYTSKTI